MFKKIHLLIVLSGYFCIQCGTLSAKNDSAIIRIKKCQDFVVTGNGSSPYWSSTKWVKISAQSPSINAYSTYSTKAKVLYSETGIYFLFCCKDEKLTSTFESDNLPLYTEDVVEVFLWPDKNFPVYFEYELSPLNYELPLMVPNDRGQFYGWLPWRYTGNRRTRHATSVQGGERKSNASVSGWFAEFFIPFKLLAPLRQVPPKSGTVWRANLYRIDYDFGQQEFSWQKIEKSFHEYNHFGIFIFE